MADSRRKRRSCSTESRPQEREVLVRIVMQLLVGGAAP